MKVRELILLLGQCDENSGVCLQIDKGTEDKTTYYLSSVRNDKSGMVIFSNVDLPK